MCFSTAMLQPVRGWLLEPRSRGSCRIPEPFETTRAQGPAISLKSLRRDLSARRPTTSVRQVLGKPRSLQFRPAQASFLEDRRYSATSASEFGEPELSASCNRRARLLPVPQGPSLPRTLLRPLQSRSAPRGRGYRSKLVSAGFIPFGGNRAMCAGFLPGDRVTTETARLLESAKPGSRCYRGHR